MSRHTSTLSESEHRYRELFENVPIGLWEKDFSAVRKIVDELRNQGVVDVRDYFERHPEVVARCAALARILDVNATTLEMYGAKSKEELLAQLEVVFTEESLDGFREALISLAEGKQKFQVQGINRTLQGEELWLSVQVSVAPNHEQTWSRVLVSSLDISARRRAEQALNAKVDLFAALAEFDKEVTALGTPRIAERALAFIDKRIGPARASVALLDADRSVFTVIRVLPNQSDYGSGTRIPIGQTVLSEVVKAQEPVYRPDLNLVSHEVERKLFRLGIRSCFYVPLVYEGKCLGTLNCGARERDGIPENHRQLLTLVAPRLAQSLAHAQLFDRLTESEELFRSMFENAAVGVAMADHRGQMVLANSAMQRILGYTLEEFREMRFADFTHPDDVDLSIKPFREVLDGQRSSYQMEKRYLHKDGHIVWGELAVSALRDLQGNFLFAIGVIVDISARKQTEAALRESERQFRTLVSNIPGAIYRCDADDQWTTHYVSDGMENITGYPAGDFRDSKGWKYADIVHPDDLEMVRRTVSEAVERREPFVIEYRIVTHSGAERWVYEKGQGVFNDDGEVLFLDGAIFDITDRRRAEEERLRLETTVQQAQKLESLGVLAGGIAHDFNNLLMGVLGNADMARSTLRPTAPAHEYLLSIETAARRAADLSNQLLAYSGRARFVVEPIDLSSVVKEMVHLVEVSVSKKAVVKYDLPADLPAIEGDATQIRQIALNLITNASDAIGKEAGFISVSTGVMECDAEYLSGGDLGEKAEEGSYCFIEVADSGCGMDSETLARIFDPFFTTKFTGRGLGLAAVLGIVRGHKGVIKVRTAPGKGSTIRVLLPATRRQAEASAAQDTESDTWRGEGTVLLVDDEAVVRSVTKRMLERIGFNVITASDGEEAVAVFERHADELELVILDLAMPRMGGDEAFQKIRQIRSDATVIISSGYDELEATKKLVGQGLAGFIQKPYSLADLVAEIRQAIET